MHTYLLLIVSVFITSTTFAQQNVGIGTSSPTDRLHVAGTTRIEGNTTLNSNLTLTNGVLRVTTTQLLTTPAIITASMAGLVPGLILNGTGSMSNLRLSSGNTASTDYIDLREEKTGNLVYLNIYGRADNNNETKSMAISSSGNIGIGTDAPVFRLDLNGDLRIRSGGRLVLNTSAGLAGSVMVSGGSGASPAWSRRYGFRVGVLEERDLGAASINQVVFSTSGGVGFYNDANIYNSSSGVFTVPESGVYFLTASMQLFQSQSNGEVTVSIARQNAQVANLFIKQEAIPINSYGRIQIGGNIFLNAGDQITMVIITGGGKTIISTVGLNNPEAICFFSAHRLY